MIKELTCVICPKGCCLKVQTEDGTVSVSGNSCPRGQVYAKNEVINPVRTLTTTMKTDNGKFISVKTAEPVPKGKLLDFMKIINQTTAKTPVEIGEVLIYNIGESGIDVVATKSIK